MAGGELDQTPTWAVASVVSEIIIISIALEKLFHRLGEWFTDRRKKHLYEALEKVKAELMLFGFSSLFLTFEKKYISKICIPLKASTTMLPCSAKHPSSTEGDHHRKLLWHDSFLDLIMQRRILAGADMAAKCKEGYEPLISTNGINQLDIFIFFLAVSHVLNSFVIMTLGRLKIRRWKEWERETQSRNYEFSNDPQSYRFPHETSFVRAHISFWNWNPVLFYIVSFFRQFFTSVRKADYFAMRHGFIVVHLSPGAKFDFQKYIERSLEDDFKVVVGISPILWASVVVFLLVNVNGSSALFWVSTLPLIIILAVGTKLQAIIARMAIEIHESERHVVVQGMPPVQVDDKHFWFGSPKLVLFLIHFTLFQNAFQLTYFFWIWSEFGLKSCFHQRFGLIIARLALGVGVQFLCSYITLPLYALVSQMGSNMKQSIFDEHTSKALKKWHQAVKKNRKHGKLTTLSTRTFGMSPFVSPSAFPAHPLQRFKTTGHSATPSCRGYFSDQDMSDLEGDASPTAQTAVLIDNPVPDSAETAHEKLDVEECRNEDDLLFVTRAPAQTES